MAAYVGVQSGEELVAKEGRGGVGGDPGGRRPLLGRVPRGQGGGGERRRAVGRRGQQFSVEIEVSRVPVPGSLGGEGRVATVHAAPVHQLEVHVLIMGLHPEVVLKHFAAGGAPPRILPVEGHLAPLGAHETPPVLVTGVRDKAIVRIHGRCGG